MGFKLEKSTRPKNELLDYYKNYTGVSSISFFSRTGFWSRITQTSDDRLKTVRAISKLYQDNKQNFKDLFGPQHFCYTTWYRGWVWFFDYKDILFAVTCSIRGTDYRMYYSEDIPEKQICKIVDEFYFGLIDLIKNQENE